MSVYFSTGCFRLRNLEEIVSLAVANGIDIELSSSVEHSNRTHDCLNRAKDRIGLLVHNYFPPPSEPFVLNLASADQSVLRRSCSLCREAIDLCAKLGAPFYSAHSGFVFELSPTELGNPKMQRRATGEGRVSREKSYERFLAVVRELARYAAEKGVGFLVENNVVALENIEPGGQSPFLLADVKEILRFFEDLNEPCAGLLLDVGHAKVSARTLDDRPERYFELLSPHVGALHLSDNDGRQDANRPFDRDAWFAPYLKNHASVPMVLEVYRLTLEEMAEQRRVLQEILV